MRFSPDFIEKVAESNNLVDLISQYTTLKASGGGLMGRCPFPDHKEKTPSFSVSEAKQVYHCFGCHKKGNIYTFLRDSMGMSFVDAVEYLARRGGIELPQEKEVVGGRARFEEKKKWIQINQFAHQYFRHQLKKCLVQKEDVFQYIEKRQISLETLEIFALGYATSEWEGLVKAFQQQKVPLELVEEMKLVKARSGSSGHFDVFRERLIFPIHSMAGEVVGFGGRILGTGEPKYLNSPESPLFVKSKILYGLYQTARYIRSEDQVLIVEGYMDLLSLFQRGIQNVAATMGTALTQDHAKILRRITQNAVVLFDGDAAGIEAAERSLPILLAEGLLPKGLTLPGGMDPDDFVKTYGAEALRERVQGAQDLYFVALDLWMKEFRGEPSEKMRLLERLRVPFLSMVDSSLRELYLQETAQRMGVTLFWLRQALKGKSEGESSALSAGQIKRKDELGRESNIVKKVDRAQDMEREASIENSFPNPIVLKGASRLEIIMMNAVLKSRANFAFYLEKKMESFMVHGGVQQILRKAQDVYRQDLHKFDKLVSLFVNEVDLPALFFVPNHPAVKGEVADWSEAEEIKFLEDCFFKIQENFFKEQTKKLALDLKSDLTPEKLELIKELQRNRLSLKKNSNF